VKTLWLRRIFENRFFGTMPSTISALTVVTLMCVPMLGRALADEAHASLRTRVAARGGLVWGGRMLHCA
jgi:hypothetical protein